MTTPVRLGQAYPDKGSSIPALYHVYGKWTGGGAAADMSVADGDWNEGIASVEYDGATGKYLVTFTGVGQQLVDATATVHRPTTGDSPIPANIRLTAFDRVAMTVPVEFGAAPSTADIAADEKVTFHFVFATHKPT